MHKRKGNADKKRNLNIYRYHKKIGTPFSARDNYYYAKEFYYNEEFAQCLTILDKLISEKSLTSANLYDSYLCVFDCSLRLKKYNCDYLYDALKKFGPTGEIFCNLAVYYEMINQIPLAIKYFQIALASNPFDDKNAFYNARYYYYFPLLKLVELNYKIGDKKQSFRFHEITKRLYPNATEVLYNEFFFEKLFNDKK